MPRRATTWKRHNEGVAFLEERGHGPFRIRDHATARYLTRTSFPPAT